jgi:hypothetical protein
MNSIQTLDDALIALAVLVGFAVVYTLAIVGAGAMYRRGELHAARVVATAPQPTPADDARVLVLR